MEKQKQKYTNSSRNNNSSVKTALVTGCRGFLGSHLCKELKNAGWFVIGIDIKDNTNQYIDLMYCVDIRDANSLSKVFEYNKIDVVYHLAGRIEVGMSMEIPGEFFSVNTGGTAILMGAMEEHNVKNIVYSSSAAVYDARYIPIKENFDVRNNSVYGQSKLFSEEIIRNAKAHHIIFRYFNLAGADPSGEFGENHNPETHLIPCILQNLNNFVVYGTDYDTPDGSCIRDYVHVSDVAEAHILAGEYLLAGKPSRTLNLGSGEGHSVLQIIDLVENVTKQDVKYTISPRRNGDPPSLVADINLAKKVLQFQPKHDIISIIKTAYDWYNK